MTGAPAPGQALAPLGAPGTWHLVFGDEFNGASLDTSKWMTHYPAGTPGTTNQRNLYGNNELEYYADDAFEFANGALRIRADRRSMAGYSYTSGVICSYPSFSTTYGFFEMRAQVPAGKGLWPAFWLLPKDLTWPPEIDVMEMIGSDTTLVAMSYHQTVAGQIQSQQQYYWGNDLSAGFHTFGVDWSPTSLTWYIDGVQRAQLSITTPSKPMYVIANLAVGGNWPGVPDASTPFPSYFNIDYIRVFQH